MHLQNTLCASYPHAPLHACMQRALKARADALPSWSNQARLIILRPGGGVAGTGWQLLDLLAGLLIGYSQIELRL